VKLVDFLVSLLEAHAQALTRLAALMTEESLLEVLERAGESEEELESPVLKSLPHWARGGHPTGVAAAYAQLETAVRGFGLPQFLLFHLWTYPHYRALIENATDLNAIIPEGDDSTPSDMASSLVDESVEQAKLWVRSLGLAPDLGARAEKAAEVPWLKFRAAMLAKLGKRRLGAV
jgi:hypothetical protein